MVDNLIIAGLRRWDFELLYQLFSQEEVEQMVSFPLSMRSVEYRRIWHYERNEKLSVRSAYHVARGIISSAGDGANASPSSISTGGQKLWKRLWNACVPGKVKIRAWRACLDSLPRRSNLAKRQVVVNNLCGFCGSHGEST